MHLKSELEVESVVVCREKKKVHLEKSFRFSPSTSVLLNYVTS